MANINGRTIRVPGFGLALMVLLPVVLALPVQAAAAAPAVETPPPLPPPPEANNAEFRGQPYFWCSEFDAPGLLGLGNLAVVQLQVPAEDGFFPAQVLNVLRLCHAKDGVTKDEMLKIDPLTHEWRKPGCYVGVVYKFVRPGKPTRCSIYDSIALADNYAADPRYQLLTWISAGGVTALPEGGTGGAAGSFTSAVSSLWEALAADPDPLNARMELLSFIEWRGLDRLDSHQTAFRDALRSFIFTKLIDAKGQLAHCQGLRYWAPMTEYDVPGGDDDGVEVDRKAALEQAEKEFELSQSEGALVTAMRVYARFDGVDALKDIQALLAASPDTVLAIGPLVEVCPAADRLKLAAVLEPLLARELAIGAADKTRFDTEKQSSAQHQYVRRERALLYALWRLGSVPAADAVKSAFAADMARIDAVDLARALLRMRGAAAVPAALAFIKSWPTEEIEFIESCNSARYLPNEYDPEWNWHDLLGLTLRTAGEPAVPVVVDGVLKRKKLRYDAPLLYAQIPDSLKATVSNALIDRHWDIAVIPWVRDERMRTPAAVAKAVLYATGEIPLPPDPPEDAELADQFATEVHQKQVESTRDHARNFLKSCLGGDVTTQAEFEPLYMARLHAVADSSDPAVAAQAAAFGERLSSVDMTVREKAEVELKALGPALMPILLKIEADDKVLAARRAARGLILTLPFDLRVFARPAESLQNMVPDFVP